VAGRGLVGAEQGRNRANSRGLGVRGRRDGGGRGAGGGAAAGWAATVQRRRAAASGPATVHRCAVKGIFRAAARQRQTYPIFNFSLAKKRPNLNEKVNAVHLLSFSAKNK